LRPHILSKMEGIGELFGFISGIGEEISNIFTGEGMVTEGYTPETPPICPLVIAGPSGVGKGTLIQLLIKEYPKCFGFSVSHTTREPRPNEVNGIHYNFTTQDVMLPMIEANEFLESANVHGNLYGTSKAAVSQVAEAGKICILDIDIQGVKSVKAAELSPQPIFVFVKAPSMEILEARLRGRGTEDDDKIAKRLKTAVDEIAYADEDEGANFDVVLTNDDLDKCYAELKAIIQSPLRGVAAFRREAALKALAEEEAKTAAAAEPAAEAPAAAVTETAQTPVAPEADPKLELQALIRQKEAELDNANASKDRKLSKTLLSEIEDLEAKLAE